tara:strand:+ start:53 stop:565 length:513 start_codon:yes stop_codon:yes gene_type:complete
MASAQTTEMEITMDVVGESFRQLLNMFPNSQLDHPQRIIAICANTVGYMGPRENREEMLLILGYMFIMLDTQWTNSILYADSLSDINRIERIRDDTTKECTNLCSRIKEFIVPYTHLVRQQEPLGMQLFATSLPDEAFDPNDLGFEILERNKYMIQHQKAQLESSSQTQD